MLSVFILTLIQSSFSLPDDPLPQNQLQLTEYGEYVTFIDEELDIPIVSTGQISCFTVVNPKLGDRLICGFILNSSKENIYCVHLINNIEDEIIKINSKGKYQT